MTAAAKPVSGGPVVLELLRNLPAASRILFAQGVVDAYGHVSMRHPCAPDRYLMSRPLAPASVTPEDLIEYDLDSNPCNAGERGGFYERFIHGETYKARPDIMAVVHSHSPSVIPFSLVGVPMQAMFHNAALPSMTSASSTSTPTRTTARKQRRWSATCIAASTARDPRSGPSCTHIQSGRPT